MIERDRGSFNLITSRGLIEEIKVATLRLDIIHWSSVALQDPPKINPAFLTNARSILIPPLSRHRR